MRYFVDQDSIVRRIWSKADTVMFIFAGSAAEFALNRAVDWLYFTGRLPADPLGRLFSTVEYAQRIIFSEYDEAVKAINQITAIHQHVETARGTPIPDWAYRSVLYMLIDCSIRSFELLERKLTGAEKDEVFDVFNRMGVQMGIPGLPENFSEWQLMRDEQLNNDLTNSAFTADLYKQYEKHLGGIRYLLLKQVQLLVTPDRIGKMLPFKLLPTTRPSIKLYKWLRDAGIGDWLKQGLLPARYKQQINLLNVDY